MSKLIVGLGNIGKEYENTNHNMVVQDIINIMEKANINTVKNHQIDQGCTIKVMVLTKVTTLSHNLKHTLLKNIIKDNFV